MTDATPLPASAPASLPALHVSSDITEAANATSDGDFEKAATEGEAAERAAARPMIVFGICAMAERKRRGKYRLRPESGLHDMAKSVSVLTKGAWAESIFQARAIAMGFTVYKPTVNHALLDFILERGGRVLRVQVKSAWERQRYHYQFPTTRNSVHRGKRQPYGTMIDFFAAYVAPLDAWYIIPARAINARHKGFLVFPQDGADRRDKNGRRRRRRLAFDYEVYREAWDLLSEKA